MLSRLQKYQRQRNQLPGVIQKINVECIKWVTVIQSLLFMFVTVFMIETKQRIKNIYGTAFSEFLMFFCIAYCLLAVIHLITLALFSSRQKKSYKVQMGYFTLNDTVLQLNDEVFDQTIQ